MGSILKNNEKLSKIITIILVGVLILIIITPVKDVADNSGSSSDSYNETSDFTSYAEYYEEELKNILENSYGKGTIQVMVRVTEGEQTDSMYYSGSNSSVSVEGVFIVADVADNQAVSDITFAVCALFDLPAHKVAVMIKN